MLEFIKQNQPDVVLLNGPFLPKSNTVLQSGIVQYGTECLTYEETLEGLIQYIQSEIGECRLVLIPSQDDIHVIYPLPQPAYPLKAQQDSVLPLT